MQIVLIKLKMDGLCIWIDRPLLIDSKDSKRDRERASKKWPIQTYIRR